MKNLIAFLVAISLLVAPVTAIVTPPSTTITTYMSANGNSQFNEYSAISGYDWSEVSWQTTAIIQNSFTNIGTIAMNKEVYSPDTWQMQESMILEGSGVTTINKDVFWWTEDSTLENPTTMKWPTVANIYTNFQTNSVLDVEEVHNTANLNVPGTNPGEFSAGAFLKTINTNDIFHFNEGVGIGMPLDCTPLMPVPIVLPICGNC